MAQALKEAFLSSTLCHFGAIADTEVVSRTPHKRSGTKEENAGTQSLVCPSLCAKGFWYRIPLKKKKNNNKKSNSVSSLVQLGVLI